MTMKTKFKVGALLLSIIGLSSCKTSVLYSGNAYEVNDLAKDYYSVQELGLSSIGDPLMSEINLDRSSTEKMYANGYIDNTHYTYKDLDWDPARKSASSLYPEIFTYTASDGTKTTLDTAKDWTIGQEGNDSEYVGTAFGRTKCLAMADSAFKSAGVLSKLYNGQMFCDGYHVKALVQLDPNGYSTLFPKTLATGDYFLMSCRGGSSSGVARQTLMDIELRFFKQGTSGYDFYTINLKDVLLRTDSGGEGDSFVAIRFSDIGITDPSGIKGMSVAYSNVNDGSYTVEENFDASGTKKNYFGLLIYEVMFPNSTWR